MLDFNLSEKDLRELLEYDFLNEAVITLETAYGLNACHEAIQRAMICTLKDNLQQTDKWIEVYKILRNRKITQPKKITL